MTSPRAKSNKQKCYASFPVFSGCAPFGQKINLLPLQQDILEVNTSTQSVMDALEEKYIL
jgi:hypothetical protein